MATKFSDITWRGAESVVRKLAGAGWQEPPPVLFREMSNIILMYIWRILDGKHDWAYRKTYLFGFKTADYDTLTLNNITGLDVDPDSLVKYIRNTILVFRTGDRITMQGVSSSEESGDNGQLTGFRAIVSAGGLTAILKDVVINDNGVNPGYFPTLEDYDDGGARVVVEHSQALNVVDLSSLFIKKIIGVSDTVDGKSRIWEVIQDYREFHYLPTDVAYNAEVACYLKGDTLETYTGPEADPVLNNPTLEYDGIPALYTEATKNAEIELFQEYYNMWRDLMEGWVRDWIGVDRGQALDGRIDEHLMQINEAMAADRKGTIASATP
jgi:hypothetical protein